MGSTCIAQGLGCSSRGWLHLEATVGVRGGRAVSDGVLGCCVVVCRAVEGAEPAAESQVPGRGQC